MGQNDQQRALGDIRCHLLEKADIRFQDGALPHVRGVRHFQAVRSAQDPACAPEGFGFTYNHAPMLAWWRGRFYLQYLAGPRGEHQPPSRAFLMTSEDGLHFSKPQVIFPSITAPARFYQGGGKEKLPEGETPCIIHHRMAFYVTSDDRLLALTFYGISPTHHNAPNSGYGVGRVVREIYEDGSFGPVYFIRYNTPAGYDASNSTQFPFYRESTEEGFIRACEELLADRLVTAQWWEEERLDTAFFSRPDGKAVSTYTLPDGSVMGVFKEGKTSRTFDGGKTWTPLRYSDSLEAGTGKVWGQKTNAGEYVLVYNPSRDSLHRWPLAIVTGTNGEDFYDLATLTPEVSPTRYAGVLKNLGPQYMRGIHEHNPRPKENAFYLTYSVNKEDIWACRVPVPVVSEETEPVREKFDCAQGSLPENWNLYVPAWGTVSLRPVEKRTGRELYAEEWDRYNRVVMERLIPKAEIFRLKTVLTVYSVSEGDSIQIVLRGDHAVEPFDLRFCSDGNIIYGSGRRSSVLSEWSAGEPIELSAEINCVRGSASIQLQNGKETVSRTLWLSQSVCSVSSILYRSRAVLPFQTLQDDAGMEGEGSDLPLADLPTRKNAFAVRSLETEAFSAQTE